MSGEHSNNPFHGTTSRNLNKLGMITDCGMDDQQNFNAITADCKIECVFNDIKERLIKEIEKHEVIVGCVAWLTDHDIIRSLHNKNVCIVVQKEDFLRPDLDETRRSDVLRKLYSGVKGSFYNWDFGYSYCGQVIDEDATAIRCVGNLNTSKNPAHPRMHNKFLIMGKIEDNAVCPSVISPEVLWTGSFNFTKTATFSFENALLVREPLIMGAYLNQFMQIYHFSESLDWDSPWVAPVMRIGT